MIPSVLLTARVVAGRLLRADIGGFRTSPSKPSGTNLDCRFVNSIEDFGVLS